MSKSGRMKKKDTYKKSHFLPEYHGPWCMLGAVERSGFVEHPTAERETCDAQVSVVCGDRTSATLSLHTSRMSVTDDTCQKEVSPSNDVAPYNNPLISVTRDTSHSPIGPCGPPTGRRGTLYRTVRTSDRTPWDPV